MKFSFHLFTIAICLTLSHSSARFFPNITNIPPWLLPNVTVNTTSATAWDAFQKFGNCRPGEKVDGLAKLKKYFNYFGYIPNLPTNFTDEFDDELQSALKTYQKNFNLNVTGELDDQTINHLVRPRCGNPDIVNGTTTMHSGKPVSFNNSKLHTVGHYSFFPGTPVWPTGRRDLTFAFLPDNELSDEAKSVFISAFQKWSTVIPMTFTETTSYYSADIKIGFFVGDHGDGEAFDGVLGTLAHAFSPPSGLFHLDEDENWVIGGDITTSTVTSAIDLESVAVHEIGHLLGLGHSSVEESIMYPTITSKTKKVDLANDDVEGIQSLYGVNPSYDGTTTSSTPSTQARETSAVTAALARRSTAWRSSRSTSTTSATFPTNFTDDFDDELVSAVKIYQNNFNLNVTGELDDHTINHLMRPRCGNHDIVNGTTTMHSGNPVSFNNSKLHTVGHYSFFPGTPVWPTGRRDLTFAFLPDKELSDEAKSVFISAFQKWSTVIPMTFTETTSYYSADIKIGFFFGEHVDGEAFDAVLGTLAHAFSPPSGLFHLDDDENWVIGGDITTSTVTSAIDLESVAVHEIGHLLGLVHSSVEESIMYPTITSKTKKVDLANDDVEGIQSLYGVNPSYDGTTTSSTPSTQERESRWVIGVVLAVGLVLLSF
ncbi:hypothetical protein ACLB2K_038825 [Fragaria x ananassa]